MKRRSIISLLALVLVLSLVLTSCAKSKLAKYPDSIKGITEEEQIQYNVDGIEDYKKAYENTKKLTSYTFKPTIKIISNNLFSSEAKLFGTVTYIDDLYSSNSINISYAGVNILNPSYSSDSTNSAKLIIDEKSSFTIPTNIAAVGGVIFPEIKDGALTSCQMVSLDPKILKFTLIPSEASEIYKELFTVLQKELENSNVKFFDLGNLTFEDCVIYVTIGPYYITDYDARFTGYCNSGELTFNLIGNLSL